MDAALLQNPIIALGFRVITGLLPVEQAPAAVRADTLLTSLSDADLGAVLDEATDFFQTTFRAVPGPNLAIYPWLTAECARVRLSAIGELRGASAETGGELEARQAAWITVTAQCWYFEALAKILAPGLGVAFQAFLDAEMLARGLPDLDRPRLPEIAGALVGQIEVASAAGKNELSAHRGAELDRLMALPYGDVTPDLVADVREVVRAFLRARGGTPSRSPSGSIADLIRYQQALNGTIEEAAEAASGLPPGLLRMAANNLLGLAGEDARHAESLARVHFAVTEHADELTRAYAKRALGGAIVLQRPDRASYEEALALLQAAHDVIGETWPDWLETAKLVGAAHHGLGEYGAAVEIAREIVGALESRPDSEEAGLLLAPMYGNLGNALERAGQPTEALDSYYRALRLFLRSRDSRNALVAARDLIRLSRQLGRSDQALTVTTPVADLLIEGADVRGAVRMYLTGAREAFRINEIETAYTMISRADDLVRPLAEGEHVTAEDTALLIDVNIWQAVLMTPMVELDPDGGWLSGLSEHIERARRAAVAIGDDVRLNRVLRTAARALLQAKHFEQALQYVTMAQNVPHADEVEPEIDELEGLGLAGWGHPEAAVRSLTAAAEGYERTGEKDRLFFVFAQLGAIHEQLGQPEDARAAYVRSVEIYELLRQALSTDDIRIDFRTNAEDALGRLVLLHADPAGPLFDPACALHWAERSKSRNLLEIMGLSPIPARDVPENTERWLAEERDLITRINGARAELTTVMSPYEGLRPRFAILSSLERLSEVWDALAESMPAYVALRRGTVVDLPKLRAALTD